MDERAQFLKLITTASKEQVLGITAIMLSMTGESSDYLNGYTRGECKRAIRLCRISQAQARREGNAERFDIMEQAAAKIRNHLHSIRQN